MARGKSKMVFDTKDLFLEGQNDPDIRGKFIRSPLFGIAVNAYNRAKFQNLELRVGFIDIEPDGATVNRVNLVTPHGVPAALITNHGSKYENVGFHTYSSHTEAPESVSRQLLSSNPKYVQSKLSVRSEHDAAHAFDRSLKSAYGFLNQYLRGIADSLVDHVADNRFSSRPYISSGRVSDDAITFLVNVYAGKATFADTPPIIRQDLDYIHSEHVKKCDIFSKSIDKAIQFMDGDKWIYLDGMNDGVVVACTASDRIVDALTRYKNHGHLPYASDFTYLQEAVPCAWYPSFNDIPDDYRKELEFSMVMLKTHRNSGELLPQDCPGGKFFVDMGCYSSTGWGTRATNVHILSR